MATLNQRLRLESMRKKDNSRTRGLKKCPHARGWVHRLSIVTPKKPNSARRPVVKALLKRKVRPIRLTAHIPGIGHTLKKFSKIMLRGRGPRDLPGVRYSLVRGVLDFLGLRNKKRRRSIYGAVQNDLTKIRAKRKYRVAIRTAENERVQKEFSEKIFEQESIINLNSTFINNFYIEKSTRNRILEKKFSFIKHNIELVNFLLVISNKFIFYDDPEFDEPLDFQELINFFNFTLTWYYNYYNWIILFFFLKKFVFFKKKMREINFFIKLPLIKSIKIIFFFSKFYFFLNFFNQNFFYLNVNKYPNATLNIYKHPKKLLKHLLYEKTKLNEFKKNILKKKNNAIIFRKDLRSSYFEDEFFFFFCHLHRTFKHFFLKKNFIKMSNICFFNFSKRDAKKFKFFFFKKNKNTCKKIKYL